MASIFSIHGREGNWGKKLWQGRDDACSDLVYPIVTELCKFNRNETGLLAHQHVWPGQSEGTGKSSFCIAKDKQIEMKI